MMKATHFMHPEARGMTLCSQHRRANSRVKPLAKQAPPTCAMCLLRLGKMSLEYVRRWPVLSRYYDLTFPGHEL